MASYQFILFISGKTARSAKAEANLRRLCAGRLGGDCDITVINLLEEPQLAEKYQVIATPALARISPPPGSTIYGDLADPLQVLTALGLKNI